MVRSAWLRRAGPGIVALGAVGMLAGTAVGARDRPWVPPDCDRAVATGDIHARAVRTARIASGDGSIARGDRPWFRLDPILDPTGALSGQRLTVGRTDGSGRRSMDLPPESFAAGPFGSVVLTGRDDGSRSELVALDVLAGCARVIDTSDDVIRRATIGPDGRTAYEVRVDRHSRADLGVWSTRLEDDRPASRIVPPIAPDDRFGRTWSTEFAWGTDDARLAIQSCGEAACRTRVVDLATGTLHLLDAPDLGTAIGLTGDRLVTYLACRGLPCPVVAVDLASGDRTILAEEAGPAVLVETADGEHLVIEGRSGHEPALRSMTLDGLAGPDIGTMPPGLSLHVEPSRSGSGLQAPTGWVVLAPDGRLPTDLAAPAPLLRHVLDGRSAAIDEVTR